MELNPADELYMRRCLELAHRGAGFTRTNPLVGCVVVKNNKIISEGWHAFFGGPHAEVMALQALPDGEVAGATVYINLEPCCHHGKTPPCTDLLLRKKPAAVVVAHMDPDPRVAGKGLTLLREAGIQVRCGVLEAEARQMNRFYFVNKIQKRPAITLKWATSSDGFMAMEEGRPVRITTPREDVLIHWLRSLHDAILVGYRTALNDDPQLTVRHIKRPSPLRLVWDPENALPSHLRIFNDQAPLLVLNRHRNSDRGIKRWKRCSSLQEGIRELLVEEDISSILVEGGRNTLEYFLSCNLWDKTYVFNSLNALSRGVASPVVPRNLRVQQFQIHKSVLEVYENSQTD
ncbi:MAG: bifunctional diaminohydroxyphosphoribosylaminopyrimidine deaminase/5-amino-6-(5-phosphoribosylamino)uracil reductase RibD [Flavobacteriales bacterium]|nr:bifunctional diaminohydroxyphosphoribosylaminopyrimidine deaminase/5-amino-6-(5-phosphoribosylamino)uracil reductase RibD [Flavobacteriales bacterium]MCX7769218.1 bifunctional diaminohydroxyphosphoribosylaminopyrimidine deaminase/5-amino-6-(5-phosphoribosylamino)uracil reductase RibD [Flavobacteriales bacterium]MDW8410429.1 bifunctional diaminohydroxyphosphoribosylaminopyrimidine deaminase/5-amino-6-(5-phosphoribosylamino)uracil reductase RibD [Flavobacteriales bacterium]